MCYQMVCEYAENNLAEKWAFARKFANIFNQLGISKCDVRYELSKFFALSTSVRIPYLVKDEKKGLLPLVRVMTQSQNANLLSGANKFEGITWFNKETIEKSSVYALTIALLGSTSAQIEGVLKSLKALRDAKEKAEYKCENLIEMFDDSEKKSAKEKDKKSKKAKK